MNVKMNDNALDKLDLSKVVSVVPGLTQDVAKGMIRTAFWQLFNENQNHTLLSIGWIHLTIGNVRAPLEFLIGPAQV